MFKECPVEKGTFLRQRADWPSRLFARLLRVGLFRIPIPCTVVGTVQPEGQ